MINRCLVVGFVYAIGGRDSDGHELSSVERLNCATETWSFIKALPKKLYSHGAAVCKGKVCIITCNHHYGKKYQDGTPMFYLIVRAVDRGHTGIFSPAKMRNKPTVSILGILLCPCIGN